MLRLIVFSIKQTFKNMIKNPIGMLVTLLIPILLAFFIGKTQSMENLDEFEPIRVSIVDEDQTPSSKMLQSILQDKQMKEVISIVEDSSLEITLEKGFEDSLNSSKEPSILLRSTDEETNEDMFMLDLILQSIGKSFKESQYLAGIQDEKLQQQVMAINMQSPFKESEIVSKEQKLSATEDAVGTYFALGYMMIAAGFFATFQKAKEEGIIARLLTTPISRKQYLFLYQIEMFIEMFFSLLVYYAVIKLSGLGLKEVSFFEALPFMVAGSFMGMGVASMEVVYFNKQVGQVGSIIIIYIQMALAGMFFSFDRPDGLLGQLMDNLPTKSIIEGVHSLQNGLGITDTYSYVIPAIIGGLLLGGISYIKILANRWEV